MYFCVHALCYIYSVNIKHHEKYSINCVFITKFQEVLPEVTDHQLWHDFLYAVKIHNQHLESSTHRGWNVYQITNTYFCFHGSTNNSYDFQQNDMRPYGNTSFHPFYNSTIRWYGNIISLKQNVYNKNALTSLVAKCLNFV